MKWILIYVVTTLHFQGGVKAVSVAVNEFQSREVCEKAAKALDSTVSVYGERVETSHSCVKNG